MLVRLDAGLGRPLYRQIADGLRAAIAGGEVAAGEQLPPAREMAAVLGVNMHTVLRAYAVLQEEGLLRLRRARGAVVVGRRPSRLEHLVHELVREAGRQGVSRDDVAAMIAEAPAP